MTAPYLLTPALRKGVGTTYAFTFAGIAFTFANLNFEWRP